MTTGSSSAARRVPGICIPMAFFIQTAFAADGLEECVAIESADERLACFDQAYRSGAAGAAAAAAAAATEAVSAGSGPAESASASDVIVPAAAAAGATQAATPSEADFGLQKPREETEGKSLTAGVAAVSRDGYDKLILELDNGQVWRQVEYKRFPVKAGQVVEIRHGSFGSYKMYIKDRKSWTRVRRAE